MMRVGEGGGGMSDKAKVTAEREGIITWRNSTRKLSDLIPWENNPVQLKKRQAKGLEASIDTFGFAAPLLISEDNELYDGHQRVKVMSLMEKYGTEAEVAVRVSSRRLTEHERQEMAVRFRRNVGEFDFDILANVFEVDDLIKWGFDDSELVGYILPEDWEEYDERISDDVEMVTCPECGHTFPK